MSSPQQGPTPADPLDDPNLPQPFTWRGHLKNICLFFAAPFFALAYAAMLPMAGLKMLRAERARKRAQELK